MKQQAVEPTSTIEKSLANHSKSSALDARYDATVEKTFLSGNQALIRMLLEQMRGDRARGLRTKAFITGYPGSPLGSLDIALRQAKATLSAEGITHQEAQNEEFAATMLSGTQMLDDHPHPDADGVVGYWFGKGPGLDRSGDALKHGNFAGTSTHGAVVILSGEDHEAKSSTVPYQQEFSFEHHGIPVLYPSSVQEFLDYGLHAAALSRYSGCWTALKLVGTLCDGGEVVRMHSAGLDTVTPELSLNGKRFEKLANHRFFPVTNVETERRLYDERHAAALAYARQNNLNRVMCSTQNDRIGIVSAGKSWADTLQALDDLGIGETECAQLGIRLAKIGMLCPADPEFLREFSNGLTTVVVVEEKRDFLERLVALGAVGTTVRHVVGKVDETGSRLFPIEGGMTSDMVAERLARIISKHFELPEKGRQRVSYLQCKQVQRDASLPGRAPNYCSGCPHNVSTLLAPGQMAWGAPGCHLFAALMPDPQRRVEATTQLGGEGLAWIGLAPYTSRPHIVQNVGDGALFHSSYQNIRFAISCEANMTFKLLINGVLANTGGQEAVGATIVTDLARRLIEDGAKRVVLITKEPSQYKGLAVPSSLQMRSPDDLEVTMKELSEVKGVTIVIYDGTCANERRRRQKRGLMPKPATFTVVNEEVCENCGDCGTKANCMSLQKVDTQFGLKTQIHQSSCNQDQACIKGECPSFVTVSVEPGVGLRRPKLPHIDGGTIPDPVVPVLTEPFGVYMPGLGGSGVLTLSAILAQAASMQGLSVKTYDQTGASQKWGAVLSSLILAPADQEPRTNKVGIGKADLYLALDLLAAVEVNNLKCCDEHRTNALVNAGVFPSGDVVRDSTKTLPVDELCNTVAAATRKDATLIVDARRIAEGIFGDYMMTNMVALGAAYQAGWLPVHGSHIEEAIRINGAQTEANTMAFRAGRLWIFSPAKVEAIASLTPRPLADRTVNLRRERDAATPSSLSLFEARLSVLPDSLKERIWIRALDLVAYQSAGYSARFLERVVSVLDAETKVRGTGHSYELTAAVAESLHKLMAYKDEYEVARLLTQTDFDERVAERFSGKVRLSYNLQPPLARWIGLKGKVRVGAWIRPLLQVLYRMRGLRGTPFDPFGPLASRREERGLVVWYQEVLDTALPKHTTANTDRLVELVSTPREIRGYEAVKSASAKKAQERAELLMRQLSSPPVIRIKDAKEVSPAPV
jgi:indolepyruvate ferredoxin oxidoreductase